MRFNAEPAALYILTMCALKHVLPTLHATVGHAHTSSTLSPDMFGQVSDVLLRMLLAAQQLCQLDTLVRDNAEAASQLSQLWDSRPGSVPASAAALQAAAAALDTAAQADYTAAVLDRLGLASSLDPILVRYRQFFFHSCVTTFWGVPEHRCAHKRHRRRAGGKELRIVRWRPSR